MTSQILNWLKQHHEELNSIIIGEERILVYCRDMAKPPNIDTLSSSEDIIDTASDSESSFSSTDEQVMATAQTLNSLTEETSKELKRTNSATSSEVESTATCSNQPAARDRQPQSAVVNLLEQFQAKLQIVDIRPSRDVVEVIRTLELIQQGIVQLSDLHMQFAEMLKVIHRSSNSQVETTRQGSKRPATSPQAYEYNTSQPTTVDLLEQCQEKLKSMHFLATSDAETTQCLELFQQYQEELKGIETFSTSTDYKTRSSEAATTF